MPNERGYTLIELAVVSLVLLAILLGIALPMLNKNNRTKRHFGLVSHTVGIHKGMVLYAQGNKDWYPGVNSDGTIATTPIPPAPGVYGTASVRGEEPLYRFAVMMRGNYFSPEYALSPAEMNASKAGTVAGTNMTVNNFSFALLRIDQPGTGRFGEWRATQNSKSPVISDRNLGPTAGAGATSNHVSPGDGWRGSVCYNDNHGVFETSNIIKTTFTYNFGSANAQFTTTLDDLFADDKDNAGGSGNDAAMVHQDAVTYVNQK